MTTTIAEPSDKPLSLPLTWRLVLAVLAGLLLSAGYALHPVWWAPWLAPVALIAAASGERHAWLMGAIAGIVAVTSALGYYLGQSGAWLGTAIIVVLRMVSWGGAARMAGGAARKLPLALAMFVLPVFVAAIEAVTLIVSIHGAAGSLAYSQMDLPGLVQVAAIGGVPAIVFIVLLPGSFASMWLVRRRRPADIAMAAGLLAAVTLAVGLQSFDRLARPEDAKKVHATLIVTDRFRGIPTDWTNVWSAYAPAVANTARADGIVVLPEKIALLDRAQATAAAQDLSRAAQQTRATIVAGIEVRDGAAYSNRAIVATPDGAIAWYTKQRLVPGFEDRDRPGHAPLMVTIGKNIVGIAVCKDMHIPSIGREYAGTAAIMAVPAWDFGQDGWMGARMTMLRGVENGYAVARSARDGLAGAYDSTGRVIAEATSTPGMTVVEADVPAEVHPTPYARFGNLFGFSCMAAFIALAGALVLRSRQPPAGLTPR